jgi:hypothetical protein
MPLAGFEPVIPESERPHTDVLARAATGIGTLALRIRNFRDGETSVYDHQ